MESGKTKGKGIPSVDACQIVRSWPEETQEQFFVAAFAAAQVSAPWARDLLRQIILGATNGQIGNTGQEHDGGTIGPVDHGDGDTGIESAVRAARDWGVGP